VLATSAVRFPSAQPGNLGNYYDVDRPLDAPALQFQHIDKTIFKPA